MFGAVFIQVARPALRSYHSHEALHGLARFQVSAQPPDRIILILCQAAEFQHLAAQRERYLGQARMLPPCQKVHRLQDFQAVAGTPGQGLVHVGQQCGAR